MRRLGLILFLALSARADGLTDLRATLSQLAATTPVRGTFELTSTFAGSEEAQPFHGRAGVSFEVDDAGLRILYPKSSLQQAAAEARTEATDPDRQTPARSGMSRVRVLEVAELIDAAGMLVTDLVNAQLVETKAAIYAGKPARLLAFKLTPKFSKGSAKHMKKVDAALSVWVADDGVPVAAERRLSATASFLLMSFTQEQRDNWNFARRGDRLIAVQHNQSQKSDGLGQHNSSQAEHTIRLEP